MGKLSIRGQNVFKKTLIGSVVIVVGFLLRNLKAGEEIILVDYLLFFVIAFVLGVFIEWTFIPYDWDKHKNKEKKNPN